MFNDEMRAALKKMHELSAADEFVEITESVGDMVRYAANEPSMGLFFVQQHTENAAQNLIKLKSHISIKSRKTTLGIEDLHDSMTMIKSMKECGNPIVGEMINDINKSLLVITSRQPKKGLINRPSSSFRSKRTTTVGSTGTDHNTDSEVIGNYMSFFTSAKERATKFQWPPFDTREWGQKKGERVASYTNSLQFEADEMPLSSQSDELEQEESSNSSRHKWVPLLEKSYDDFRPDREVKMENWLDGEIDTRKW